MSAEKFYDITLDFMIGAHTLGWLKRAAKETGRPVENLAEAAIEEATLAYAKSRGWL